MKQYVIVFENHFLTETGGSFESRYQLKHCTAYNVEDAAANFEIDNQRMQRKARYGSGGPINRYEILGVWPYVDHMGYHNPDEQVGQGTLAYIPSGNEKFCRHCGAERQHPIHDKKFKNEY